MERSTGEVRTRYRRGKKKGVNEEGEKGKGKVQGGREVGKK